MNFIPGYVVIEDADDHERLKRGSRRKYDDDKNVPGLAYSEEPLNDAE